MGCQESSFTVVLICITLIANDVEHLLMGSLAICISSLEKYHAHFLNLLLDFLKGEKNGYNYLSLEFSSRSHIIMKYFCIILICYEFKEYDYQVN